MDIKYLGPEVRSCKFDKDRDIAKVLPGMAIDINDALQTGVIKDVTSDVDSNGIEEPQNILGRVESEFDAIEAQRAINRIEKGKKKSDKASVSAPPPASTPPASTPPASTPPSNTSVS